MSRVLTTTNKIIFSDEQKGLAWAWFVYQTEATASGSRKSAPALPLQSKQLTCGPHTLLHLRLPDEPGNHTRSRFGFALLLPPASASSLFTRLGQGPGQDKDFFLVFHFQPVSWHRCPVVPIVDSVQFNSVSWRGPLSGCFVAK
jgi:hypothetical protein